MKRTERKHLKENELVHLVTAARDAVTGQSRHALGLALAIAIAGAAVLGYFGWRNRADAQANSALGEAMTIEEAPVGPPPQSPAGSPPPPTALRFATDKEKYEAARTKFKTVADEHPSTEAGIFARYREGAALMMLGNPKEAVTAFEDAVTRGNGSIYGEMARLGLADALARNGEYDRAIETYKSFADRTDGPLPIDGILMQLGRTYRAAGKTAEAKETFSRIVDQFPGSPFSAEARRELDALGK
jgi:TolA-binding protein